MSELSEFGKVASSLFGRAVEQLNADPKVVTAVTVLGKLDVHRELCIWLQQQLKELLLDDISTASPFEGLTILKKISVLSEMMDENNRAIATLHKETEELGKETEGV